IYVRFWTVKMSCVVALRAAKTFKRWRPDGVLTNSRCTHQSIPRNAPYTKCAASIKKTTRSPAWASAKRGSRLFFERLLGLDIGFGRDRPHFARLHPQGVQKLPHLCRPARDPGQLGHLRLGFGDRRGGMRQKIGFQRPAILLQDTLPSRDRDLFELGQSAPVVLREVTIIGRFGDGT